MQNETASAKETNLALHLRLPRSLIAGDPTGKWKQGFKGCQAEEAIRP